MNVWKSLQRQLGRTVVEHELLAEGDRVLVALSGGKDSSTLLELLVALRRAAPIEFELVPFHLDQAHPGHDPSPLARWVESRGMTLHVHREDTHSVVLERVRGTRTIPCAPCSRLRRGILTTWAQKLGCNRIALGHHRDDALETLLLNLFHAGRLQAMPAGYRNAAGLQVIRPLIACAEADIARHAQDTQIPILPCGLCGSIPDSRRRQVRKLLHELETSQPGLRQVMFAAMGNVRPTHLLDRAVASAWVAQSDRHPARR